MFTIPADRANHTLVLRGTGPALHVKAAQPSKMFVVTKSRTQAINFKNGATNVRFAA
jgi:hypothetical protein